MATKKLKTIAITTKGSDFTVADTTADPQADYALKQFAREEWMSFKQDNAEYYVPFHAVDHIIITETDTEVADKPSPYGC